MAQENFRWYVIKYEDVCDQQELFKSTYISKRTPEAQFKYVLKTADTQGLSVEKWLHFSSRIIIKRGLTKSQANSRHGVY